ncbi:MAG: ABC transporter ATP-binding protein/permease [Prevotellaceae bacterium]|jgi:subfamily B ATP-binding cassette protein MsbA|nr:ABC transporter ATP-binding protein/permease [Prevotellaceae bacterium]
MIHFFKLIVRFAPPYKLQIFLNILFNFLGTVFSLFSFALIIPILQILFKTGAAEVYNYTPLADVPLRDMGEVLKDNLYFLVTDFIDTYGGVYTLLVLAAVLTVMTAFKTGFSYLASFYMIPIRTGVLRDLRNQMFRKITTLHIGFFSNERKGDIMSRMMGDVSEVENSIMSSLDMMFKNPIMILIYLITMLLLSWQLTIFVLILLPLMGYLMGGVSRSLKRKSRMAQEQTGELFSQVEETLGGLRVIKAFNAEPKVVGRFAGLNETLRNTMNKVQRKYSLAHPMSEFLGTCTIAVILVFGGWLILENNSSLTAAGFIYYIVIFYSIINPAKDLSKAWYSIQKGLAALERVDKILMEKNNLTEPRNPVLKSTLDDKIEYRNVHFKYTNDWVLKNVNITVPKGKTIALVGQSGSGKSTAVDLLPRFYDCSKGGIFIDNVNVKDMRLHDLRELMGNVNQEAILFNDTFFNNITFGVENATLDQVMEAAKIANAHEFIMATEDGYDTNIGDRGNKLSGGQRQRISIARAILKNPPILILDEATSALDTESEKLVQEALENLMRNRTTVVIAHRLSTIKNADCIYVMFEGEVVEQGTHDELIAKDGYYRRLQEMQAL